MASEAHVLMLLAALAEQCGEQVMEARLEFMTRRLLALNDLPRVCEALEGLLETAKRFPTVGDIKDAMGMRPASDESLAAEAATRILGAISKYGSQQYGSGRDCFAVQQAFIGEIGWHVVNISGGWQFICDSTDNENMLTAKAQWRGMALAAVQSAKRGTLDLAPALPPGPAAKAIAALADSCDITMMPRRKRNQGLD